MERSGFFNGSKHEYGELEFARYFENIYESGVSMDDNDNMTMKVEWTNNQLVVNPGFAMIKGYYFYHDDIIKLPVEKPGSGIRYDRVVVRLDSNGNESSMAIVVKKGNSTNAADLERANNIYEISLAIIKVNPSGIVEAIIDERADLKLCGCIRPKNISSYKTMIESFEAKFEKWLTSEQVKARNVYVQSEKPNESVSGSIWIETSKI